MCLSNACASQLPARRIEVGAPARDGAQGGHVLLYRDRDSDCENQRPFGKVGLVVKIFKTVHVGDSDTITAATTIVVVVEPWSLQEQPRIGVAIASSSISVSAARCLTVSVRCCVRCRCSTCPTPRSTGCPEALTRPTTAPPATRQAKMVDSTIHQPLWRVSAVYTRQRRPRGKVNEGFRGGCPLPAPS